MTANIDRYNFVDRVARTHNIKINVNFKMKGFDWLMNGVALTNSCDSFEMVASNPFILKLHLSLIRYLLLLGTLLTPN